MNAKELGTLRVYPDDVNQCQTGITLRQHFAGLAMQGLLSRYGDDMTTEQLAGMSVDYTDSIIAELAKET